MIEIVHGDGLENIREYNFHFHIITDPPYEMDMDELYLKLRGQSSGTIIMFSYLGDIPRGADEYHVWVKQPNAKNISKKNRDLVEAISVFHGDRPIHNSPKYNYTQSTNVHYDLVVEKLVHPHQKPVELMRRLIRNFTNSEDMIVDPFAGSGTTLIAAKEEGRGCIGFEIDEARFKIIQERIG